MEQNQGKKSSLQKLSFFPSSYPLRFLSVDPDASCGVTLTWEQHGTPCTAAPVKLNFWHIECSLPLNTMSPLTSPPPLFLNGSILSQEKIKSSGGEISPRRKSLQLCSHVQETEGMWGSLAVKWLSVLRCCTARWHNTVKECICQASSAKSEPIADLGGIFFFFIVYVLKGFRLKLI